MTPINDSLPKPFLKWVGGKRQLLPELLIAVEAAGPFKHYYEPFLGGGALFFALARTGQLNARSYLSDVNHNLIDAYLGVRDHVDAVIKLLKQHQKKHSEAYFYEIRARTPRTLSQKAARIIYLNKTCYNGLYRENSKGRFNAPFGRYKNPNVCDEVNLKAVAKTLNNAQIIADEFTVVRSAKRGDLVYFDPPYNPVSKTADFTAYSRNGFGPEAQRNLARAFTELADRGVKVIMSNSFTDFTRELYKEFYCYEVFANRRINSHADKRGKISEVLITNFQLCPDDRQIIKPLNGRDLFSTGTQGGLERMLARQWLYENGYKDIAAMIDAITEEWKAQGKQTRRNWWEILAGGANGKPRIVANREFPVLRAAQRRQGLPVTKNAIARNRREKAPPVRVTARWAGD